MKGRGCVAIINEFNDVRFVFSGRNSDVVREIIRNRKHVLVTLRVSSCDRVYDDPLGPIRVYPYLEIIDKGVELSSSGLKKVLLMNRVRRDKESDDDYFDTYVEKIRRDVGRQVKVISIEKPDEEELLTCVADKDFVFQRRNVLHYGDVEYKLLEDFMEILLLRDVDSWLMRDEYMDVKLFLQKYCRKSVAKNRHIAPLDIRNLNVNRKLLNVIREECTRRFHEPTDFCMEFRAESEQIQAQYMLTRYHSNPLWDANPVNVLCYRFSSFLMPGKRPGSDVDPLTKGNTAWDMTTGAKYRIDSAHYTTDICYELEELTKLMRAHYVDIDME